MQSAIYDAAALMAPRHDDAELYEDPRSALGGAPAPAAKSTIYTNAPTPTMRRLPPTGDEHPVDTHYTDM